jgi:hypothetical protein
MTLHEPNIEVLLESARGAREPTARDRARNRTALEARLGPLGPGNGGGHLGGEAAVPRVRAGTLGSAWRWKLTSLAGFTATLGFLVGLGLGREVRDSGQPSPPPAAPAAAVVAAFAPSEVAVLPPPPIATAEPEITSSAPVPRQLAQGSRQTGRTAPQRWAKPATASDSRFLQALRLLERAQRALDAGEAALAMSLLDDLDAGFPRSLLAEERQLARVLGWCGLGDEARARSTAASLIATNARSIYAGRLERSCVVSELPEPSSARGKNR